MTPLDGLIKAKLQVERRWPYLLPLSGIIRLRERKMTKKTIDGRRVQIPFATNGKLIFYNPEWVENRMKNPEWLEEFIADILHEMQHILDNDIKRMGDRDKDLWNWACDVSNERRVKQIYGFERPNSDYKTDVQHPIWEPTDGMCKEEVYQWMLERAKKAPYDSDMEDDDDEGDIDDAALDNARAAVKEGYAKHKGDSPGAGELIVEERKGLFDWKRHLRAFCTSTLVPHEPTWARPNRRLIWRNMHWPGVEKVSQTKLAVLVDSSGSCAQEFGLFVGEVNKIIRDLQPYEVEVVQCDARVQDAVKLRRGQAMKPVMKGIGGSDFRPAFEHFESTPPTSLVVFSDMEITFPDKGPSYPTLGIRTGETRGPDWLKTYRIYAV